MTRPTSAVESYLLDRLRKGAHVNPLLVALKGAIFFGLPLTFGADLMRAAANDTRPDFGSSALVCVPAAALLALAGRWIIGRILHAHDPRLTRGTEKTLPPIPNRSPDSP